MQGFLSMPTNQRNLVLFCWFSGPKNIYLYRPRILHRNLVALKGHKFSIDTTPSVSLVATGWLLTPPVSPKVTGWLLTPSVSPIHRLVIDTAKSTSLVVNDTIN